MTRIVVISLAPPATTYDEIAIFNRALSSGEIAAQYNAQSVNFSDEPQAALGWEEVYGPDQPLTAGDVPVLTNGLCRVRWISTLTAYAIDLYVAGFGWEEQGRVTVYHYDPTGAVLGQQGTLQSARVVEWTQERAVLLVTTLVTVSAVPYRMQTYLTLQRGWSGPRFECYPSPRPSDGATLGAQIRFASASTAPLAVVEGRNAIAVGDDSTWVDGAALGAVIGASDQPWVALGGDGIRDAQIAVARAGEQLRTYNDTAAYGTSRKAIGVSAEAVGVRGYTSMRLGFGPLSSLVEAETYMNPAGTRTSVADAAASGGTAVNDSQAAATASTLVAVGTPAVGRYGVWARVRATVSGDTVSLQTVVRSTAGDTVGTTYTTTSITYVWLYLGEMLKTLTTDTFDIRAWRSVGTGAVRIDRVRLVPTEMRTGTAPAYDGARDHGLSSLNEARSVPELVSR